ncbi:Os05g0591900 [Oryza sativa Japonica Group]|jgi:hypothetical protein|uniref:Os05g0591900 protein n=1 Tax=Oryza sativa subsp. japonica TaxID=39947 RepID=A0A0P0WRS7_ORYSJ|nr:Os05g0591900 [Oryza sativa Japonica Group]
MPNIVQDPCNCCCCSSILHSRFLRLGYSQTHTHTHTLCSSLLPCVLVIRVASFSLPPHLPFCFFFFFFNFGRRFPLQFGGAKSSPKRSSIQFFPCFFLFSLLPLALSLYANQNIHSIWSYPSLPAHCFPPCLLPSLVDSLCLYPLQFPHTRYKT